MELTRNQLNLEIEASRYRVILDLENWIKEELKVTTSSQTDSILPEMIIIFGKLNSKQD